MTDHAATSAADSPQLWAIEDIERLRMHNGMTLLVCRSTGTKLPVSEAYSLALWNCQVFRTLPDHVAQMLAADPSLAGQEDQMLQLMEMLRDNQLLTNAEQVCQRINNSGKEFQDLAPSRVCVITCDRPAAVERLLETLLANAKLSQHEAYYLIDDSRDEQNAQRNRELAESFSISSPVTMHYVGAPEQRRLLAALIDKLPDHEAGIRFVADRERWRQLKSYGLSRTMALLLTVGRRCIVLDDDVVCASFRLHQSDGSVNLSQQALDTEFFSTVDEWRGQTQATEQDPLAGHASCLGRNFSNALQKLGVDELTPQRLEGASTALTQSTRGDSPVVITQCGSLGDPGTEGNGWIYQMPPAAVKAMLESPGGMDQALVNRQNWVGFEAPTFLKWATMSQVTGLDNTQLLPPYFPVFRGEDAVFGSMVSILFPQSLVLEYDWSVPHLPLEHRSGKPEDSRPKAKGGLSFVLNYMFESVSAGAEVPAQLRLQTLSSVLEEFSQLPDADLIGLFHKEVARTHTANFASIEEQLKATGALSPQWQQFLQQQLQHVLQDMQQVAQLTDSYEVPADATPEQVLGWFRLGLREFAAVLRGWEAIRAAAAEVADAAIAG